VKLGLELELEFELDSRLIPCNSSASARRLACGGYWRCDPKRESRATLWLPAALAAAGNKLRVEVSGGETEGDEMIRLDKSRCYKTQYKVEYSLKLIRSEYKAKQEKAGNGAE
jgi:hypothetical protein